MSFRYRTYKKQLAVLEEEFENIKEQKEEEIRTLRSNYWAEREELINKIKPVCPHEEEQYEDTWHPHTRSGDQYYECKLCGHRRFT